MSTPPPPPCLPNRARSISVTFRPPFRLPWGSNAGLSLLSYGRSIPFRVSEVYRLPPVQYKLAMLVRLDHSLYSIVPSC